ncbi:MAG TPA: PD-(D/E)XK nuclease family protein [Gaiellaceae bacterium]|nr:PD-(D/E)XK nuclease family protein [Gaiellaceae bacterium]
MGLRLLAGPANAGKVELLLDRYVSDLGREPVLIVPNGSDVERVERDLLRRCGALLGGSIGTFDDVFERIAAGNGGGRAVAGDAQRSLVLRRVVAAATLSETGVSSRFGGFADALGAAIAELEAGLLDPDDLDGDLAELYRRYRAELDALGLWDRDLRRRYAADRIAGELEAWDGRPVYAYGFEDLTGAQWRLLEAFAGRVDVTVSLPYEPARPAFALLDRTATDLARLAGNAIEELPPRYGEYAHPALAHLERALFEDVAPPAPRGEGAIRFLEGAGTRATLELVADEVLQLLRGGTAAEEILVVCPSLERVRAPLEAAFGTLGLPYALEGVLRLSQTPFGRALTSLLRFAWLGGSRRDLFAFVRSPFSGLPRSHADFLEGRLRGRGVRSPERIEAEIEKLRGQSLPFLDRLRAAPSPLAAVRELAGSMLRAAYGLDAPPAREAARLDLRSYQAVLTLLDELDGWVDLGGTLPVEEIPPLIDRAPVRAGPAREGSVAVLDLLRARTRRAEVVFVVGLEEGGLPQRTQPSPFLDDDRRRELDERARLARADGVTRARYLFYTACTRASRRLYLVREAATDDGAARQASPFWDDVRAALNDDDLVRWTRRRPLSQLVWPIEAAPTERERVRALAWLATTDADGAAALAQANGWDRRLDRARRAFDRSTRLTDPALLETLRSRTTFGVTELEAFAGCSSIWFVERLLDPKSMDVEVDARMRGSVAHQALFKFFSGLPKRLGAERVPPERLDDALEFLRECLAEALAGGAEARLELTDLQRNELEQGLWRDLEALVRAEAESELKLVPRKFEVGFGSERSAVELRRGLDLGTFQLSGKIDRIDLDPFSARGIVWDYKSGAKAHSAAEIERELRLQIPLYMLVLRDLVGIEPLGGLYRPLAGDRKARGLLRATARADGVPGYSPRDYVDEEEFWAKVGRAEDAARSIVARLRAGDVQHDPREGTCPSWCELAPMCRIRRA